MVDSLRRTGKFQTQGLGLVMSGKDDRVIVAGFNVQPFGTLETKRTSAGQNVWRSIGFRISQFTVAGLATHGRGSNVAGKQRPDFKGSCWGLRDAVFYLAKRLQGTWRDLWGTLKIGYQFASAIPQELANRIARNSSAAFDDWW